MCGGLARWLRGLGYDATFSASVEDGELVELARREGRVLISGDGGLFERRAIRDGVVRALYLPHGMKLLSQVRIVVETLRLGVSTPRCMSCGGELAARRADEVGDRVPAKSLIWATEFFECSACRRVYWNGTHWKRISAVRRAAADWLSGGATG